MYQFVCVHSVGVFRALTTCWSLDQAPRIQKWTRQSLPQRLPLPIVLCSCNQMTVEPPRGLLIEDTQHLLHRLGESRNHSQELYTSQGPKHESEV
jgi:hypothetical protein